MDHINAILNAFKSGAIGKKEAARRIAELSLVNLGHTRVDIDRETRTGAGEVIFGQGKTAQQIIDIARTLLEHKQGVLITRIEESAAQTLKAAFPKAEYFPLAKIARIGSGARKQNKSHIAIITAGTSDIPIAQQAQLTAEFLGSPVEMFYDCGVAGLHRLTSVIERIRTARVAIVVAGMEGALPSVVAGLIKAPVIAVPTSVGYGASFGGLTALLAMLNSCANGVSVVNIDNGFGAGYNAHLINSL